LPPTAPKVPPTARVYCLVARTARKAVVFRRGPNRHVRLLTWDLKSDHIDGGQWLKGRIYERRCDLSPDGSLLVYFAAKFRGPVPSWTAVSRPPFFSALSFFPKGDCWGGGGLFDDDGGLCLNHRLVEPAGEDVAITKAKKAKHVPRYLRQAEARPWERIDPDTTSHTEQRPDGPWDTLKLRVRELGEWPGSGEDNPILSMRLERDGWNYVKAQSQTHEHGDKSGSRLWLTFDPPVRRLKAIPGSNLKIQVSWHGLKERDNRWYVETLEIVGLGGAERSFGQIDWADLDHNGDVLIAADGRLMRASVRESPKGIELVTTIVADLNGMTFEGIPPSGD
jgi:hypothetical protein